MEIDLSPFRALVGGSTAGIGLAIARQLALSGAEVVLLARDAIKCENVLFTLSTDYGQIHDYIVADQSNPEQLSERLHDYLSTTNNPFHIVINNTGGPAPGPLHKANSNELSGAFNQHIIASHLIMQACLPGMMEAGYGRIINIISTSVKAPLPNLGVSNTIRAAMANWSKTLANELASYGITVNNILPGATDTDRLKNIISTKASHLKLTYDAVADEMKSEIPAGRFGLPEEIANAAVFLASPLASYINGINLPVDGGRTPSL
ncbi:SDR family oxidoreductase [Schleiferia thermophila]|jgi:3-oxoacyl-[acyl-carrier protein] reductase|uniref:3-oxoacyl-[acyl-carrier protein] reductase n=1 Tax=Schleiferia thermophila TaxID=884107 RepID=A0A369A1X7_9FLAO|nr:SDR family oxidoreductase [Schleiferia thermophila]KFD39289.1 short-chain dehydrogenase [Schleiferia thermophila str. Yellowstone]RCX03191.1 3-oxoacyl-[acyl-carrier protein] reductase [Schleiferia thermophila]GCD80320.1 3-oxoacyl-ACP reductase [Schleiferia thermophila]